MERYSWSEYADMIAVYGEAQYHGRAAARIYQERFPERRIPHHSTFAQVFQRLKETGSVDVLRPDAGRRRTVRTPEMEEDVLSRVERNPSTSTRAVAAAVGATHTTVWKVLHEQLLHPYKRQKVQSLNPADYPYRQEFVQWFLRKIRRDPDFSKFILFTDEARFTREGLFNSHNSHVWTDENPHAVRVGNYQERFSVNVWAGIVGDCLLGPYILPDNLRGDNYLTFLQDTLPDFLEFVPLFIRRNMWFQHDGAPAHYSQQVRNYLNTTFPNKWIGRGGPVAWPVRSPDLSPVDFYLWGHLKSMVYETPVASEEELVARIVVASGEIKDDPSVFARVRRSLVRRYRLCKDHGGRHFEHLL